MSPSKNGFQKTLFSFFTTKPSPAKKVKTASPPRLTDESSKRKQPTLTLPPRAKNYASSLKVGMRVKVYWPLDDEFYKAKVIRRKDNTTVYTLFYEEDGEEETVDMAVEVFEILEESITETRKVDPESEVEDAEVEEDSEEDNESVFKEPVDESSDDEEFNWDDEEEVTEPPTKRKRLSGMADQKIEAKELITPTPMVERKPEAKEIITPTPRSLIESFSAEHASNQNTLASSNQRASIITPIRSQTLQHTNRNYIPKTHTKQSESIITPSPSKSIPKWIDGVAVSTGSHMHNYLNFLNNPCDLKRRPISHPEYDARTLYVNFDEIAKVLGKSVTPAQQQWWEVKQYYFDCILFFKTGKFYEIFHMDADIVFKVNGFKYMKGCQAHNGAPEAAYGNTVDRLVKAGYKVARVEQTETPEQLAIRKKKIYGKNKPKVVSREVCSIASIGTRKFDFMDKYFTENGPLLIIREVVLPPNELNEENNSNKASCEYGVTIVDAVRSCVTMGQFADDVLRSRMHTLLTNYAPSEILLSPQVSSDLRMLIQTTCPGVRLETINNSEIYPISTAVDPTIRKSLQRSSPLQPWDVKETISELHRCSYFPKASKKINNDDTSRWPTVLQACIDGNADLAISVLGGTLFYLQRCLIAHEIFSMGNFKAYIPPSSATLENHAYTSGKGLQIIKESPETSLSNCYEERKAVEDGATFLTESVSDTSNSSDTKMSHSVEQSTTDQEMNISTSYDTKMLHSFEQTTTHLEMDGTTLMNLEILSNQHDSSTRGTLWEKVNHTKTPHGNRLLRAWLLRPLFQKSAIERRSDAVTELLSGEGALAIDGARSHLSKCGDLERFGARIFSMKLTEEDHPQSRAVLYEAATNTKKKVEFFSKMLVGLQSIVQVRECFNRVQCFESGMLEKVVRSLVHEQMEPELNWFLENFDCIKAAKGNYEPTPGLDPHYDLACEEVTSILQQLQDYKEEMCRTVLPSSARSQWKYINIKPDSRDKYLIELPASLKVPHNFVVKAKRGSGAKQVNKYSTPTVVSLIGQLDKAYDEQTKGRARGMSTIFARFDSKRPIWEAAIQASALLDALQALAKTSSLPGYSRPVVLECDVNNVPKLDVQKAVHPCVEVTHTGGEFIPNDLTLGGKNDARLLLLSGPNMGGKSTLLRSTCLIVILAQIGCYVPADSFSFSPMDRIFTRLGATDRILSGQSTFFVELAETSAALRGATKRSLVIMDELGRGTSTFDGTAIAHSTVKHLVDTNKSLVLFATHYHSLLEDWRDDSTVRLGHMECMVEGDNITFLYTLGKGACPKSFGINVARLAALPNEVLERAKIQSNQFEEELLQRKQSNDTTSEDDFNLSLLKRVEEAIQNGDIDEIQKIWDDNL